jgi:hypothetical protein
MKDSLRRFDIFIAFTMFHSGILVILSGVIISLFFLNYPTNIILSLASLTAGILLMIKGIKIGKSVKNQK